jgi:hypothetical protein
MDKYPSLEEFLVKPGEEIAQVAPQSLVFYAGGTRREAAFAGVSAENIDYAARARSQMIDCFDLIFRHGVKNILTTVVGARNFHETGAYREQLINWINWGLAGDEALADYSRYHWRVRLLVVGEIPELKLAVDRLIAATPASFQHTVWFHVVLHEGAPWELMLKVAREASATTHQEVLRALYGENIPPATLLLGHGKPEIPEFSELIIDNPQCYWSQNLGYGTLTEEMFRTILHDYAYLRATWRENKRGRAGQAVKYQVAWENPPIIGAGVRLGPFWYPAPIDPFIVPDEELD